MSNGNDEPEVTSEAEEEQVKELIKDPTGSARGERYMKGMNMEKLEQAMKFLNSINEADQKSIELNHEKIRLAHEQVNILLHRDAVADIISNKEEALAQASGTRRDNLKDEIADLKKIQANMKENTAAGDKLYKRMKEVHTASSKAADKANAHMEKLFRSTEHANKEIASMSANVDESVKGNRELIRSTDDILGIMRTGVAGLATAMSSVSLEAAALATFMPSLAPSVYAKELEDLPNSLDKNFRAMTKSGIKYTAEMDTAFIGMLDPLHQVRTGAMSLEDADKMFINVGLKAEDAQKSMSAIKNGTIFMREAFIKADSAKALDQFTKVLGQSPRKAANSL